MLVAAMYFFVFFDVDKPKDVHHSLNKRIDKKQYDNISDGIEGKTIEIKTDGVFGNYSIIRSSIFNIVNSVDNHYFCICECKKLKSDAIITIDNTQKQLA